MSDQTIITCLEKYNENVTRLKQACLIQSRRMVNLDVFYHMPDNPHILHDFIWQTEDHIFADKVQTVHEHTLRMKNTEDHFEIPFHDHDPIDHSDLVDAVPFIRTRQFLAHWLHHIDGPLHTVAVTHHRLC